MKVNNEIEKWCKKIEEINNGTQKNYFIMTMGCQLNENDSEKLAGILANCGYKKTDNVENADIIVFNTCCVRENAEERLLGKLGEVKKFKEEKGTIIAIGGCMMQEKNMVNKLKESYPFVDIVFGTHTLEEFPKDLYFALSENKKITDILDEGQAFEDIPVIRNDKYKASVTIMNGCNNFCTYCIVPYVRGREKSREPQNIINEIEELAKNGYKEITLLGQNVNSYLVNEKSKNPDLKYEVTISKKSESMVVNSFATLLYAINEIDGIERIRFISPHPKDFTDDVIEAIKDCDKVCKLIHLPLQSGSTNVLNKMNRKYSKEQYLNLAYKIKEKIPEVRFSTDIIVGFPGETDEDFEDTLDVVRKLKYEQIFMFIYSRRVGTPEDKMENQVDENVAHKRFDKLKKLYEELVEERNKEYIGTVQNVLVEGKSKTNENMLTGRSEFNKVVVFEGKNELIGKMVKIKIISEHMWYLKGECDKI
jgi:tRNA-2-methylthio-N6-dimethylallyladenosine synthase